MTRIRCCFALSMVAVWTATAVSQDQGKPAATQPSRGLTVESLQTTRMRGATVPPTRTVIRYKGSRSRVDMGDFTSSITQPNGDTATLFHSNRTYYIMSRSLLKEGMDRTADMVGTDAADGASTRPASKFVATGKTQQIASYETKGYTLETPMFPGQTMTTTYWFASDFPNADAVVAVLKQASSLEGENPWAADAASAPRGFPIRTEFTHATGAVVVNDVVSATLTEIDDSTFEIPADYRRVEMPNMQTPR